MMEKIKWFYKTDNGRVAGICLLVGAGFLYMKVTGTTFTGKERVEKSPAIGHVTKDGVKTQTEVDEFQSGAPRIVARPAPPQQSRGAVELGYQMLPIDGYTSNTNSISDQFAPYGQLIKCKLVNTLESNNSDTPIKAMVMEDVYFNGQLLMQAGITNIEGTINTSRIRDRINGNKNWIAVWTTRTGDDQNGKELPFTGIALAYAPDAEALGQKWELIDGSAGLKGYVIDTTDMQKLLMIAAAFIQGAGQGLTQSTLLNDGGGSTVSYDG